MQEENVYIGLGCQTVYFQTKNPDLDNFSDFSFRVTHRVTRLGEFLPIGWFFLLGSFFENDRSSANLWTTFLSCISHELIVTK
jgi:hypothetical protein